MRKLSKEESELVSRIVDGQTVLIHRDTLDTIHINRGDSLKINATIVFNNDTKEQIAVKGNIVMVLLCDGTIPLLSLHIPTGKEKRDKPQKTFCPYCGANLEIEVEK